MCMRLNEFQCFNAVFIITQLLDNKMFHDGIIKPAAGS